MDNRNYRKQSNSNRNNTGRSNVSRNRQAATSRKRKKRQQLIIRIITIVVALALIATFVLGAISCNNKKKNGAWQETEPVTNEVVTNGDGFADDGTKRVTLTAVGDIIAHETILNLAETDDGYDFTSLFALLKNDISSVDLAIANVETPLGGGPYTGYPNFNTPDEMGLAVIDAGFDVALQASNHSMDAGTDGIRHSIGFWKNHANQILMVGMHDSQEEADQIPLITVNGITFAILNYTYGLNGYELPNEEDYLVTLMNDWTWDYIREQVERASQQADFVIVCPHWGEENQVGTPNDFQREWAQMFTEAGADLILGTHPHVIQDIEWITADNGNKALCYYSLGNFVSNQQYTDLVLGGMAYLVIEQDEQGTHINEESAKVIPVVTHNDKTDDLVVIQTYYLADYTQDLADVHDTYLSFDEDFSLETLRHKAQNVFGSWMIDRIPKQ